MIRSFNNSINTKKRKISKLFRLQYYPWTSSYFISTGNYPQLYPYKLVVILQSIDFFFLSLFILTMKILANSHWHSVPAHVHVQLNLRHSISAIAWINLGPLTLSTSHNNLWSKTANSSWAEVAIFAKAIICRCE